MLHFIVKDDIVHTLCAYECTFLLILIYFIVCLDDFTLNEQFVFD